MHLISTRPHKLVSFDIFLSCINKGCMYVYVNELTASDVRENGWQEMLFVSVSKRVFVRKQLLWNCIPSVSSFSWKSNSFSFPPFPSRYFKRRYCRAGIERVAGNDCYRACPAALSVEQPCKFVEQKSVYIKKKPVELLQLFYRFGTPKMSAMTSCAYAQFPGGWFKSHMKIGFFSEFSFQHLKFRLLFTSEGGWSHPFYVRIKWIGCFWRTRKRMTRVALCLCVKTSIREKKLLWNCIPSVSSFSWKSNSFSWEKVWKRTRCERGSQSNSEMANWNPSSMTE